MRALAVDATAGALWVGTSLGVHEIDLKTRNVKKTYTRGDGLAIPLDAFEVTVAPGAPAALLPCRVRDAQRWTLCDLATAKGYAAALAVEGSAASLSLWHWPSALAES